MFKEFKEFAMEGSIIDLAVGVIIGGAFGKIIASLVDDILMPVLGILIGRVDFSQIYIPLGTGSYDSLAEAVESGVPVIKVGMFLNHLFEFLIIAFALFMIIKQINKFKREEKAEVTTKACPYCMTEIDLKAVKCPNCTADLEN